MRKVKIKDLTPSRPDKEWSLTDPKRGLESEHFQQRSPSYTPIFFLSPGGRGLR
ncbi:MAG: hypothetical protein QME90_19695 [Thermodesulfobacteriota bacterium]|nr:hypothetical protein [Thermodesulfobacteriota bacterium]